MDNAKKSASNPEKRWDYLIEAEKIAMEDYAFIPVFEKGSAVLQSQKVKNLIQKPVGVPYDFTYVEIAE